jgi:hypothetical protein
MISSVFALLLFAGSPRLAPWSNYDTASETVFALSLGADMSTTVYNGEACREINPILGRCPDRAHIFAYGMTTLALHAAIARVLPQPYRGAWQFFWIGTESVTVVGNLRVGARFEF